LDTGLQRQRFVSGGVGAVAEGRAGNGEAAHLTVYGEALGHGVAGRTSGVEDHTSQDRAGEINRD
jgi:hypothetical protein